MGKVLLTGAGGFLGGHAERALKRAGWAVCSTRATGADRVTLDLETPGAAATLIRHLSPDVVIHAAAESAVGACERDPEAAARVNQIATAEMIEAADETGARFIFFSTDQVLDGSTAPYADDAPARPLHVYGRVKAAAEEAVLAASGAHVVLRIALAFGDSPSGRRSASEMITVAARNGQTLDLFTDEIRSPVAAGYVGEAVARLAASTATGRFNLGGPESINRYAFGQRVARAYGLDECVFRPARSADLALVPSRPSDVTLDSSRLYRTIDLAAPPIDAALESLARHAATRPPRPAQERPES